MKFLNAVREIAEMALVAALFLVGLAFVLAVPVAALIYIFETLFK